MRFSGSNGLGSSKQMGVKHAAQARSAPHRHGSLPARRRTRASGALGSPRSRGGHGRPGGETACADSMTPQDGERPFTGGGPGSPLSTFRAPSTPLSPRPWLSGTSPSPLLTPLDAPPGPTPPPAPSPPTPQRSRNRGPGPAARARQSSHHRRDRFQHEGDAARTRRCHRSGHVAPPTPTASARQHARGRGQRRHGHRLRVGRGHAAAGRRRGPRGCPGPTPRQ